MVKGTSRRVVVVKSPDPLVFEEAIFIVKEDFLGKVGHANALKEAQQVANDYIRAAVNGPRRKPRITPLLWAAAGALLSAALFVLIRFI